MNKEKLKEVVSKYKNRYYHNLKTILPQRFKTPSLMNLEFHNIAYDLFDLNITKNDVDFVWNDEVSHDRNTINLLDYIEKLEIEDKLDKAIIHLAWYCIIKENDYIKYGIEHNQLDIIYIRPGQTFVTWNIETYNNRKDFRTMVQNWETLKTCIRKKYEEDKKNQ